MISVDGTAPDSTWGDGTRVVTGGASPAEPGQPLIPSPVFAAPFHLGDQPVGTADGYARISHPSIRAYERALAGLDGGPVVAFPTGMAAISALLLDFLRPGEVLVLPSDGYYTTRTLAANHLAPRGVEVREVPTAGDYLSALAGAALVLLETPSNPGLDVCDIAEIAAAAHREGARWWRLTTPPPPRSLGQLPLALGADFAVYSDTKAIAGHSDLLLGHVACATQDLADRLSLWRRLAGAMPGPFEVWLAHRSLGTLDLRLGRQAQNALALIPVLSETPGVTGLRYPGWPADPAYELASRQMRRHGGVLSCPSPSPRPPRSPASSPPPTWSPPPPPSAACTPPPTAAPNGVPATPSPRASSASPPAAKTPADLIADVTAALEHALT
ncbi:PLP-dependent transferase [Fodinicola feengrottensis]|uniref:PLP-dependent transferase n=1 Tax=Fodinicola feengrottensis TaxID=435914 RepID=UPI002442EF7A|nr:PLP-dependent transferase [Fodinicola feengrottensis]